MRNFLASLNRLQIDGRQPSSNLGLNKFLSISVLSMGDSIYLSSLINSTFLMITKRNSPVVCVKVNSVFLKEEYYLLKAYFLSFFSSSCCWSEGSKTFLASAFFCLPLTFSLGLDFCLRICFCAH